MRRLLLILLFLMMASVGYAQPQVKHVVLISFDGLRPDSIKILGKKAGAFNRMIKEGASTLNARTDYDYTVTLPNHACMITGYPVLGPQGHGLTENSMLPNLVHDYAGHHVYSVFDTLRKNKHSGAMLASKSKFNIFEKSFPMDVVAITNYQDEVTLKSFEKLALSGLPDYVFMHFSGTDHVGHQKGWRVTPGSEYMKEVLLMNQYLERVMRLIQKQSSLKDSTVLIVTTDHGGQNQGHGNKKNPLNYTIPFMIWGKTVARGVDLYQINTDRRENPLGKRIDDKQELQPIRNGDAANLALSLLGLPSVEGSTIGNEKPLKVNKD